MTTFRKIGAALAASALVLSMSAQAGTRSGAALPQEVIVHPVMPEGAEIVDDETLDYCFEEDLFTARGTLLKRDTETCGGAGAAYIPAATGSIFGNSGAILGALAGVLAAAGLVTALGNNSDTPDSPG